MQDKIIAWLEEAGKGKSERDRELLERCCKTLMGNVFAGEEFPWDPYTCISPGIGKFDGIWNWDSAFHAIAVSRWSPELAWNCIFGMLQYQTDDGLIPDVVWKNGDVIDAYGKPPVFPWATEIVYGREPHLKYLLGAYDIYVKNESFWHENRFDGKLLHYDCNNLASADAERDARYESGWDNSVRWDGRAIKDLWCIDLNCYMILFYRSMKNFAQILRKPHDEKLWAEREALLRDNVNELLWDEELGAYVDTDRNTGERSKVLSPASFMPLFAGIATPDRAERMALLAADKNKFYPLMPTVSYDDPEYSDGYWRGPCWLNTAYFAAKGLKDYGFAVGDEIKEAILDAAYADKGGIFENYDAKTGKGLYCPNFSWSSVFVIEFILGF